MAISIHAPLAGSDQGQKQQDTYFPISIHAPLAGSDGVVMALKKFPQISIHAPLAGSDLMLTTIYLHQCDFNPRSPCGERRGPRQLLAVTMGFQSTLPLRGATALERQPFSGYTISIHAPLAGSDYQAVWSLDGYVISIHAPLAGSDRCLGPQTPGSRYFNPRSPCGERLSASFTTSIRR